MNNCKSVFKNLKTERLLTSSEDNKTDSDFTILNSLIDQNKQLEDHNLALKEEIRQIKKERRNTKKLIDNFVTKICKAKSNIVNTKSINYRRAITSVQYNIKKLK